MAFCSVTIQVLLLIPATFSLEGCGGKTSMSSSEDASETDASAFDVLDAPTAIPDGHLDATVNGGAEGAASDDGASASTDVENRPCFVQSNYDQSCTNDDDCVAVIGFSSNLCLEEQCYGKGDGINIAAKPKYDADFAKTPIGAGVVHQICNASIGAFDLNGPCCRNGTCQMGEVCPFGGSGD